MRTVSFLFCIFLSIFVILLLSVGVQGTEYKEIDAKTILAQIEKGEDVNYSGYHIKGELDASKIKLRSVHHKTSFFADERFYVVESEIIFKNSYFEDPFIFREVLFDNLVNFTGVTFNSGASFDNAMFDNPVDFTGATFNNNTNFTFTTFNSGTSFDNAIFNSSTDFTGVTFDSGTSFDNAMFDNPVKFTGATFNSDVPSNEPIFISYTDLTRVTFNTGTSFDNAIFNSSTDFTRVTFNTGTSFDKAIFNSSTDFSSSTFYTDSEFFWATFNNDVNFAHTKFNDNADQGTTIFEFVTFNKSASFESATFNSSASFTYAIFNNTSNFRSIYFNDSAYFEGSVFNKYVDFTYTSFNHELLFSEATFNERARFMENHFNNIARFDVPDTSENITTDGKSCAFFMKEYNDDSRYTDANNIYYNYRKTYQDYKDLTDSSKWVDFLSWVTCGYGTRISHTLKLSTGIIFFFACLYKQSTTVTVINRKNKRKPVEVYWKEPKFYRLSEETDKKSIISFFDALYFSIMVFTTLGSEWNPRDNYRKWVALEGILGYIMLGIFLATLNNVFRISSI